MKGSEMSKKVRLIPGKLYKSWYNVALLLKKLKRELLAMLNIPIAQASFAFCSIIFRLTLRLF